MALEGQSLYSAIKAKVRHGEFGPDGPLRETQLSDMFGVSRTPVREALNRLLHDGIIERRGRGLYARPVPLEEIFQVYDLRVLLEGEAASQAAESRRKGDLLALQLLVDRDAELVDPPDDVKTSTNLAFHAAIWTATNNGVLRDILERLSTHLIHAPMSTLSMPGRWEVALEEHRQIVEAIRDRDAQRARQLAGAHMLEARDLRVKLFTEGFKRT